MKKKGFVLMETIVVIVVISIALIAIFTSYNKILSKLKSENKYDNSEYIYMTKYVRAYLQKKECVDSSEIYDMSTTDKEEPQLIDFYKDCTFPEDNNFNIKKIHIINNITEKMDKNLSKFDANIIDYIKKLYTNDNDPIIIVEYKKDALDNKGNLKKDSKETQLEETYIASLEW